MYAIRSYYVYRDQASLLEPGIEFHVDPVEEFRLDKNEVKTKSGKVHGYDVIAIATGSRPTPRITSYNVCYTKLLRVALGHDFARRHGLARLAENAELFYTEESAVKMYKRLRSFSYNFV